MLLLLCRRRATRSGGGGAAEHDALDDLSLRADRPSARALGPREKVCASQHTPAPRRLIRPRCAVCRSTEATAAARRRICGRGRRPFRPLVERGHPVGDQGGGELSSPASSDVAGGPLPPDVAARAGMCWLAHLLGRPPIARQWVAAAALPPPSADPCTSRAVAYVFADVVSVCECLVMPTFGWRIVYNVHNVTSVPDGRGDTYERRFKSVL